MNELDWYTDLVEVRRVRDVKDGSLTRHERVTVRKDVPCRVYRSSSPVPRMGRAAASVEDGGDKLACANSVDIQAGDELLIRRGARLGQSRGVVRAFAGDPVYFHEPFGAVVPGLAHQEIGLLHREYLKGEVSDGAGERSARQGP